MIFLGNHKDWIKPEWIEEALSITGLRAPRDMKLEETINDGTRHHMHPDERAMYKVYGMDTYYLDIIEEQMFSFKIDPPWLEPGEKFTWWITRMKPGQLIPLHRDGPQHSSGNRYWMPLTPYEFGHIFVYEDIGVANYNVGDLWVYDDPLARHGAVNIGTGIRLMLQVSTFGDNKL